MKESCTCYCVQYTCITKDQNCCWSDYHFLHFLVQLLIEKKAYKQFSVIMVIGIWHFDRENTLLLSEYDKKSENLLMY